MNARTLRIAGEPGIFGRILTDLGVTYTVEPDTGDRFPDPRGYFTEGTARWADHFVEVLAAEKAEILETVRRPSDDSDFHAGVQYVVVSDGRQIVPEREADLSEALRAGSCVAIGSLGILPIDGLSLPHMRYHVTIGIRFAGEPTKRDASAPRDDDRPYDPIPFLARRFRRMSMLAPDELPGPALPLGEILRIKREELKGMLDILGYFGGP